MNKDSIIIGKKEFRRINDNYYISSKGEVYSKFSKRILKCQIQNKNNKANIKTLENNIVAIIDLIFYPP